MVILYNHKKFMSIYENEIKVFEEYGIEVFANALLSGYTSFNIGGECKFLLKPKSFEEIAWAISKLIELDISYYFLGNGSNVLVSDKGYDGVIILLSEHLSKIEVDDNIIECYAGAKLTKLCNVALDHSLSGLEFAFGIPGTVGGAIHMNAGAYGGEIKDVIQSCTFLDENNQIQTYQKHKLDLSYRHSIFTDTKCCILKATFKLEKADKSNIKEKMDDLINRRITKQPLQFPSAGSTFKRPENNYASALIDQCGLKGERVGDAMVSEKHCGFIINAGEATCEDVLMLIDKVKYDVYKKTGYTLECEVKKLGF